MIKLKERIKELRKALGLTQTELGDKIGIGKTAVSKIENGSNGTTDQTLRSLCREFGASYTWLTTGKGSMFENGDTDASLRLMVDRIMASENEWVKQVFKSLGNLSPEDWKQINDLLDKLLAGANPWEANITQLHPDGQKNIAAARSGDRMEAAQVSKEEEDAVLPPPYTGDI